MFAIAGYLLSAGMVVAGVFKLKQIAGMIKEAKELFQKVRIAKHAESEGGRDITANEWREIAEESLDLLQAALKWWKLGRG
ncbi:MAG: hypothetical protein IH880_05370 [Candidatus Marinimicrobia bacterium]|nr:hypothetical protein [Candidatus Neomarinimicrobiota bacterium]MCH8288136.1 hypothetical protein [Candidatus Neomarinimicrobiota bacterium]